MPNGHAPFALMNVTGNRLVKALLRSPLHPVASRRLALISYTGRRSGLEYSLPVMYKRRGDQITVPVEWPARKVWWRNLTDGGPVTMRLAGTERSGKATAIGTPEAGVTVEVVLDPVR